MQRAAELLEGIRCLVFDFDGTLVDSNPIKWRAFEVCFQQFPDRLPEILAYCRSFNHVPRDQKFRTVYEQILRRPYDADRETALLQQFDRETTERIIEAPAIEGAEEFLRCARQTRLTALLSSTPHETLIHILHRRGWMGYFQTVQGAPICKSSWLSTFPLEHGWKGEQVVFFGDTLEDAQSADRAGCQFVRAGHAFSYRHLITVLKEGKCSPT